MPPFSSNPIYLLELKLMRASLIEKLQQDALLSFATHVMKCIVYYICVSLMESKRVWIINTALNGNYVDEGN